MKSNARRRLRIINEYRLVEWQMTMLAEIDGLTGWPIIFSSPRENRRKTGLGRLGWRHCIARFQLFYRYCTMLRQEFDIRFSNVSKEMQSFDCEALSVDLKKQFWETMVEGLASEWILALAPAPFNSCIPVVRTTSHVLSARLRNFFLLFDSYHTNAWRGHRCINMNGCALLASNWRFTSRMMIATRVKQIFCRQSNNDNF